MPDTEVAAPPAKEHWATKRKREREALSAASGAPTVEPVTQTLGSEQGATVEAPPTGRYMDPAEFFGPIMAALLASGRAEAQHLETFAKEAWGRYTRLVDWARAGGA